MVTEVYIKQCKTAPLHRIVSPSCFTNTPLPPPLPPHQQSQFQPPRSPSPEQPGPPSPQRTHPPPFLLPRTSGRTLSWRTSDQTCDPDEPRPQRWQWCWTTCRLLSEL